MSSINTHIESTVSRGSNEDKVYRKWKEEGTCLQSMHDHRNKEETFVTYDGPPFATGLPHYGHILASYIKDTILRYAHNSGLNCPRHWGWDCHGLPIEYEIEKEKGIKTRDDVLKVGIDYYNNACASIVLKYTDKWEEIMGRLGRWVDFENDYKTMSPQFMNSTWWTFKELYEQNRIYRGVKIMPYSTACSTPLSNFETQQNYKEIKDDSLYFKVHLKEKFMNYENVDLLVWTTTPWTLPANYALCVNKDMDYQLLLLTPTTTKGAFGTTTLVIIAEKLVSTVIKIMLNKYNFKVMETFKGSSIVGMEYEPLFPYIHIICSSNNVFKVYEDDYVTDTIGTGIVHLSPPFGEDDNRVCLKNGVIKKETLLFNHLDANGYINDLIPECKGYYYKHYNEGPKEEGGDKGKGKSIDFNTFIILKLKEKGLFFAKEQIIHNYPFCWRSDTPLIYRAVNSYFVKVEDMREKLVSLNDQINWYPSHVGKKRFSTWLENAKDWGISRTRFWGTPIPIWVSEDGDEICVGSSYELEILAELPFGSITDLHRHHIDKITIKKDGKEYRRCDDVLDCWFESGAMPYGSLSGIGIVEILRRSDTGIEYNSNGYPYIKTHDNKIHNILPADFIAEGLDQTRGWFYTLLVLSASLFSIIPFKNVIVNGIILAEDGKKMSKRLKNYPDPIDIVNEYGSDALRLYLLSSPASKAEPLKFNKAGVHDMMKEIIIPLTNTISFFKVYYKMACLYSLNEASTPFIITNHLKQAPSEYINCWIILQVDSMIKEHNNYMKNYDLKNAILILPKLVELLNNGYIKLGRSQLKGKCEMTIRYESLATLYYIIKCIISNFKNVMPFFCEHHYVELKEMFENEDTFFRKSSIHLTPNQEHMGVKCTGQTGLDDSEQEESNDTNQSVGGKEAMRNKASDFDDIYNMVVCIYQVRGTYNISLKKPIKKLKIATSKRLSSQYNKLLSIIADETNILEIEMILIDDIDITKTYKPIKSEFFKKYGGSVSQAYGELVKLTSYELEQLLLSGTYKSFALESHMFLITTMYISKSIVDTIGSIDTKEDNVYKELTCNNEKVLLIIDKHYDQELEKKYYYRLVATKIQRCRKAFGLKPWNNINVFYDGVPTFPLDTPEAQEQIYQITNVKLSCVEGDVEVINNERKINEWFNVEELGISLMIVLQP
jgi:isoleucyl-tRNA synthetase